VTKVACGVTLLRRLDGAAAIDSQRVLGDRRPWYQMTQTNYPGIGVHSGQVMTVLAPSRSRTSVSP